MRAAIKKIALASLSALLGLCAVPAMVHAGTDDSTIEKTSGYAESEVAFWNRYLNGPDAARQIPVSSGIERAQKSGRCPQKKRAAGTVENHLIELDYEVACQAFEDRCEKDDSGNLELIKMRPGTMLGDEEEATTGRPDLGRPVSVIHSSGYANNGGLIGYNRSLRLDEERRITAGVRTKVYRRWVVPRQDMPFNYILAERKDMSDVEKQDMREGTGFVVDLTTTFALRDPVFNTTTDFSLRNLYGGTWYVDNRSEEQIEILALGSTIAPLHLAGIDAWNVRVDRENPKEPEKDDRTPIWHFNTGYRIGKPELNITPKLGYTLDEREMFGDEPNNRVRTGLSTKLDKINISIMLEHNLRDKRYSVGSNVNLPI